ncbi:hypothetical protein V5O48_019140 [Marasmius crinis-equi]|uniref:Uncharacterized protein n=1 Tax=Marasmius crinis-equi TaxID=585013 RepID=A0ABR3EJA6_9AGAR
MSTKPASNVQTSAEDGISSTKGSNPVEPLTRNTIKDMIRDVVAQSLSGTLQESEYDLLDLDILTVDWSSVGTFTVLPSFLQSMCSSCEGDVHDHDREDADTVIVDTTENNGTTTTVESAPKSAGMPSGEDAVWDGARDVNLTSLVFRKVMDELTRGVKGQGMSYQVSADDARAVFAEKIGDHEVEVVYDKLVSFDRVANRELFP